jgi:3-oxocholest-4-en-26-oyl-CoA dehydrogenase alpha subunit
VDFDLGPSSDQFRAEARAFVEAELTPERLAEVRSSGTAHNWAFHRALADRGWLAPGWPVEFGGQGRDPLDVLAFQEELDRAGAPMHGAATTMMIAGVIREIGTPEQRAEILPKALGGEILIVLGFTEPECGSDVASAATRAIRDGDHWVVNGQKMFTTNAHVADYVFLLTRTNPEVPKHKGLTTFLVPLRHPGITIHPVMTMSGERTNVTYYDDVHVDDAWRIGEVDGGWAAMNVALTLERVGAGGGDQRRLIAAAERLAAETVTADGSTLLEDEAIGARLARAATEARVTRLLGLRSVWLYASGALSGVEGSMAKLFASESFVRMADDLAMLAPAGVRSSGGSDAADGGELEYAIRHAQATTIYGGTSEIQRSIIAQRHLGLPRPA